MIRLDLLPGIQQSTTLLFLLISRLPLHLPSQVKAFSTCPVHVDMENDHNFTPMCIFAYDIAETKTSQK